MATSTNPIDRFMNPDAKMPVAPMDVLAPGQVLNSALPQVAAPDPTLTNTGASPLTGLADILAGAAAPAQKMLGSGGLMHVKGVAAPTASKPSAIDPAIYAQLASLLTGRA